MTQADNLWGQALASLDYVRRGQHIVAFGTTDEWCSVTTVAAWDAAKASLIAKRPHECDTEAEGLGLANSDLCDAYAHEILNDTNAKASREMTAAERGEFDRIG